MEQSLIKATAACLAGTAIQAREKQADLWESAAASPATHALMGAGVGALAGGAGGGLLSWLRPTAEERQDPKHRRAHALRDILAGGLIGGGLGASAGAIPGLVTSLQAASNAPMATPPNVVNSAISDIKHMLNYRTATGGTVGAGVGTALWLKYLRHKALSRGGVFDLGEEEAADILRRMGIGHSAPAAASAPVNPVTHVINEWQDVVPTVTPSMHPAPEALGPRQRLADLIQGATARGTFRRSWRDYSFWKPEVQKTLKNFLSEGRNYWKGNLAASKVLESKGHWGKAGLGIAVLSLLSALAAQKTTG